MCYISSETCRIDPSTETDEGVYDFPLSYRSASDHQSEMTYFVQLLAFKYLVILKYCCPFQTPQRASMTYQALF